MPPRRLAVVLLLAIACGGFAAWLLRPGSSPGRVAVVRQSAASSAPAAREGSSIPAAPLLPTAHPARSDATSLEVTRPTSLEISGPPSATAAPAPAVVTATASTERDGTTITGRVVRLEGTPVEGAWIAEIGEKGGENNDPFGTNGGPVRTDADGRFSIPATPGRRRINAILTGYRGARSGVVHVAKGASVDAGTVVLAYEGVGTLRARLQSASGEPLAGKVTISARTDDATPPALAASGLEEFIADERGVVFPLRPLTAGRYILTARMEWRKASEAHAVVPAGAEVDVTFSLAQDPGFFVRFVDDATSAPVPGIRTGLPMRNAEEVMKLSSSPDAGSSFQGGTDMEGRFYLTVPEVPGVYTVRFRATGHAGWRTDGTTHALGERWPVVEVPAGGLEADAVIRLVRGRGVEGRVTDASGAPVSGATIAAIDARGAQRRGRTDADADGRYSIAGISLPGAPACSIRVLARASSRDLAWAEAETTLAPDAPGAQVDFTLGPAATLVGKVVDAEGRPVESLTVEAAPTPIEGRRPSSPRLDATSGRTSADGTFRLEGLRPGPNDVRIFGGSSYIPVRSGLALPPGETAIDLVYDAPPPVAPTKEKSAR